MLFRSCGSLVDRIVPGRIRDPQEVAELEAKNGYAEMCIRDRAGAGWRRARLFIRMCAGPRQGGMANGLSLIHI